MQNFNYVMNTAGNCNKWYTTDNLIIKQCAHNRPDFSNIILYRIDNWDSVTDNSVLMQSLLTALPLEYSNIFWLLTGNGKMTEFYYGFVPDYGEKQSNNVYNKELMLEAEVFECCFRSFFHDSKCNRVDELDTRKVMNYIYNASHISTLEGCPGNINSNNRNVIMQRLPNLMEGDTFTLVSILNKQNIEDIQKLEKNINEVNDYVNTLVATTRSCVRTKTTTQGNTNTVNCSLSNTNNHSKSNDRRKTVEDITIDDDQKLLNNRYTEYIVKSNPQIDGKTDSIVDINTDADKNATKASTANEQDKVVEDKNKVTKGETCSKGCASLKSVNDSCAKSCTHVNTESRSRVEITINSLAKDFSNYLNTRIKKRIVASKVNGLYLNNVVMFADSVPVILKLSALMQNCYCAESDFAPIKTSMIETWDNRFTTYKQLQFPQYDLSKMQGLTQEDELLTRATLSQFVLPEKAYDCSFVSGDEAGCILCGPVRIK